MRISIFLLSTSFAAIVQPRLSRPRHVLSAEPSGECLPEIRLLHVQDSTATFSNVIKSFEKEEIVENLIAELQKTYGIVKYGLSTFQDKPAPFSGYGLEYSVWKSKWNNNFTWDTCYRNVLPLSGEHTENVWSKVRVSGGKDQEENQLDGLARAAIDPSHWTDGNAEYNEFGQPIARLALMITDDLAHHGSKNDHDAWGFDVTYRGSQTYWNDNFGSFDEDQYDYRVKSDFVGSKYPFPYGQDGSVVKVSGENAYEAYVICHDNAATELYRKNTLKSMMAKGVVAHVDFNDANEVSDWWSYFCLGEAEKDLSGRFTGVFEFVNDYKLVETDAISDYPYGALDFGKSDDCTTYEYPDTTDKRYADMFLKNNVIPMALIAPAETYKISEKGQYGEYAYRSKVFSIIANHCPKVRASCESEWFSDCTGPYGGMEWDRDTIEQKLAACYKEHYDVFFDNLKSNGTSSYYLQMEAGKLDAATLAKNMKKAIDGAIGSLVCITTTTAPTTEPPSTVATTTVAGDTTTPVTTTIPVPVTTVPVPVTTIPVTTVPVTTTIPVPVTTVPVPVTTVPVPVPTTLPVTSETTASTTVIVVPPPPVPSGDGGVDGGTIGVAVGSAAGGAAAIGAVAAAYMRGLFGGASDPDMDIAEDVDVPESTIEREMMQEVDADMFN